MESVLEPSFFFFAVDQSEMETETEMASSSVKIQSDDPTLGTQKVGYDRLGFAVRYVG